MLTALPLALALALASPTPPLAQMNGAVNLSAGLPVPAALSQVPVDPVPLSYPIVVGTRTANVRVPPNWLQNPELPAPLLILLHGNQGDGNVVEGKWNLAARARQEGYLYVTPDGGTPSAGGHQWNATDFWCSATVNDEEYLRGLIAAIKASYAVDQARVYVAGYSNGGFMAHHMGSSDADALAGIVSLSGANWYDRPSEYAPDSPVHVLVAHGRKDGRIKWVGGPVPPSTGDLECTGEKTAYPNYPSVIESVAAWAQDNLCTPTLPAGPSRFLDLDSLAGEPNGPSPNETEEYIFANCPLSGEGSATLWKMRNVYHGPALNDNYRDELFAWLSNHRKPRNGVRFCISDGRLDSTETLSVTAILGQSPAELDFNATELGGPTVAMVSLFASPTQLPPTSGGGTACLGGTPLLVSTSGVTSGTATLSLDLTSLVATPQNELPGTVWNFQAVYQDGSQATYWTDAYSVTFAP